MGGGEQRRGKGILKFGGRERRGASSVSVSPLKTNACSGHLERFTISSTHGCTLLDNRGSTTELKSVVKLSDVTAGQLIGNFE